MANKKQVAEVVAKMSAAFPNWSPDKYTVQVYYEDLKDIPGDVLSVVADACRTEPGRKFAPSTGEIRGAWMELIGNIAGIPLPGEAWNEVTHIGKGKPWSHPLVEKACKFAGGWWNINNCDVDELMSYRARFLEFYKELVYREKLNATRLPEVKAYIEDSRQTQKELSAGTQIKRLSEKLGQQ